MGPTDGVTNRSEGAGRRADPPAAPTARPGRGRRHQTGVRTLLVLVACCAALLWAARSIWESDPTRSRILALRRGDEAAREAAARELGAAATGDHAAAVAALVEALRDPAGRDRVAAAQAMLGMQLAGQAEAALEALERILSDPSPEARAAAVAAFGVLGRQTRMPPPRGLEEALHDQSAEVRLLAVAALGTWRGGTDSSFLALLGACRDPAPAVRRACIQAIKSHPKPSRGAVPALLDVLASGDPEVRHTAIWALSQVGRDAEAAIPALIEVLAEPIDPGTEFDPRRPPNSQWDPACPAAVALGRIAPGTRWSDQAVSALRSLLASRSPVRRLSAAQGLGLFGPAAAAALPDLEANLPEALAPRHRSEYAWAIVQALGQIAPGTPRAGRSAEAIAEALQSYSSAMRLAAANALGRFGPDAAAMLPRLRELRYGDPELGVRQAAASAVRDIETSIATPAGEGEE